MFDYILFIKIVAYIVLTLSSLRCILQIYTKWWYENTKRGQVEILLFKVNGYTVQHKSQVPNLIAIALSIAVLLSIKG